MIRGGNRQVTCFLGLKKKKNGAISCLLVSLEKNLSAPLP